MDLVFCADRRVLPGLHAAARSALEHYGGDELRITVFSDSLTGEDRDLLRATLDIPGKECRLEVRLLDARAFAGFGALDGSHAPYFRLHAAQVMEAERFVYLDVDTLCGLDLSALETVSLGGKPVGWVPEAPMSACADKGVRERFRSGDGFYFNSGVMLVDAAEWKSRGITRRAMEYLASNSAEFWDQSALNVLLHHDSTVLEGRFNTISNMRGNWPTLKSGVLPPRIIHFADHPKPWDLGGELVHPLHPLWRKVLDRTALAGFRSWHDTPARKWPSSAKAVAGYRKALKDRFLFLGYSRGLLPSVKGVPFNGQ